MRTIDFKYFLVLGAASLLGQSAVLAQQADATKKTEWKESDYYAIRSYEIPPGVELEATSFQRMPDGKLAVASRRGEIWMIEDPLGDDFSAKKFTRFAHGLHVGHQHCRSPWLLKYAR